MVWHSSTNRSFSFREGTKLRTCGIDDLVVLCTALVQIEGGCWNARVSAIPAFSPPSVSQ